MLSQELRDYIVTEYNNIKSDPTYANHIRNNNLKPFDEDKIFHIRRPMPDWCEWRILSYNALRSTVRRNPSEELTSYLNMEYEAIKNDHPFNNYLQANRLRAFDKDKLFHIASTLPGFNEWRILSYNSVRTLWLRYQYPQQQPPPCYQYPPQQPPPYYQYPPQQPPPDYEYPPQQPDPYYPPHC